MTAEQILAKMEEARLIIKEHERKLKLLRAWLVRLRQPEADEGDLVTLRELAAHHGVCRSALSTIVSLFPDRMNAVKHGGRWHFPKAMMELTRDEFLAKTTVRKRDCPMVPHDEAVLTIDQAAEHLDVSAQALYRKLRRNAPHLLRLRRGPHDPLNGRLVVRVEDLGKLHPNAQGAPR